MAPSKGGAFVPPSTPIACGELGTLRIRAHLEDGLLEHEADYHFVGRLENGVLAFAPPVGPPIFLHESEIITFERSQS